MLCNNFASHIVCVSRSLWRWLKSGELTYLRLSTKHGLW